MHKILKNKWFYIAIAAAGAFWWYGQRYDGDDAAGTPPAPVSIAAAARRDVPVQVGLVGTVVAYETVAIKSRLDSQVVNVAFKDGDHVEEGQVLFELDDRALNAQIQQLEADLAKEKAQLTNSRLQHERAQKLLETKAVAPASVDNTRAAYSAQQALVSAAQAALDNARVLLSYTTIKAPISGRTGTINVTRGNNVKANDTQALVTINRIKPIRAQFSIPQRYYEPLKTALAKGPVAVEAAHPDSQVTASGTLEYIDNAIDTSTGTFAARATFNNEDEKLWPGMFVNVTVRLGTERNALTIPSVAVQGEEGSRFVFVVKDDTALRREIEVAQILDDIAIIAKGIEEGEQVVTDGILRLTDGAKVEIVSAPSP